MIERCTELAGEWNIPVFIAQLDLKKHLIVFPTTALLKCYVAKTFVLNWWLSFAVGGAAVLWKFVWDM